LLAKTTKIGAITGRRYGAQVMQAYRDYKSGFRKLNPPLPPNVTIDYIQLNTSTISSIAVKTSLLSVQDNHTIGIIGPAYSDEALPVASLGSAFLVPVLSPTAQSFLVYFDLSIAQTHFNHHPQ
jgi:hypothetical protein